MLMEYVTPSSRHTSLALVEESSSHVRRPFQMYHLPQLSHAIALTGGYSSVCPMGPHRAGPLVFTRSNLLGIAPVFRLGCRRHNSCPSH